MTIAEVIKEAPVSLILGAIGLLCLFVLLIPVALKIGGLTGAQIADTLNLTMQFFVNLVHEFRDQNKNPP